MSIIKVVKRSGKTFASLKKILSYVGKKATETFGLNCNDNFKNVAKEFIETKKFFNKEEGRQCHFIVNSVNFETGKKLHENRNDLDMKKKINDDICLEYGINNKQELKKEGEIVTYDKNKYQIIKKGADITRLAESILNVIQVATSKKDFLNKMKNFGYEVEWNENKTHIVFSVDPSILIGKKNKFRLSNLQKTFNISDFSKERLLDIFENNLNTNKLALLKNISRNLEFDNHNKICIKKNNIEDKSKSKKLNQKSNWYKNIELNDRGR